MPIRQTCIESEDKEKDYDGIDEVLDFDTKDYDNIDDFTKYDANMDDFNVDNEGGSSDDNTADILPEPIRDDNIDDVDIDYFE